MQPNNYAAVPRSLKDLPNWVVWRNEKRKGKWTKTPYDARTGDFAKSNDSSTWTTFDAASKVANDILSKYDGVGFMLHGSKFVGIDFDGVVDDGVPEPYVVNLISQMGNPYCEITPSGTGLRVFVECAQLPPGSRKFSAKKKGIEKYGAEIYAGNEGGRYLTVTGQHFSGEDIPSIPNLDLVHFLISKFADEHFRRLWMGDASEYENDASRVDLALLGLFARAFNGDVAKMTRFFDASVPGHREKWIERADYRELTIGKALTGVIKDDPEKSDVEVISVRACDVVPVPIEFLWHPYIQQNALNAFYGNPGIGKGNTGIDIVARLTTGRPFPTEPTTARKPMNVAILVGEESLSDTVVPRLMGAGADLDGVRFIQGVRLLDKNHHEVSERLVTFQEDIVAVREDLRRHPEERFLFIDPITDFIGDVNFNQDGEVRPVLTLLSHLSEELNITTLMVGHFNKNNNVSSALDKPGGGRAWTAVPRTVWGFFRKPDDNKQRVMVCLKANNAEESDTSLLFTISGRQIGTKPNGSPWTAPYVEWGVKTTETADDMVAAEHPEARRDNKGVDFIHVELEAAVRPAIEVYKAAEADHISESTLKRACATVGVMKFKMPGTGWLWQHPNNPTPIPDAAKELNEEARRRRNQQEPAGPESAPVAGEQDALLNPRIEVA